MYRAVFLALLLLTGCNLSAPDSTLTPSPTPNIPRVEFLRPTQGDRVVLAYDMPIDIVGYDDAPNAGIARIELLLNGEVIREATVENDEPVPTFRVEMNWFTQGPGQQVLSAIAYRRDGTPSDEAIVTVEVVSRTPTPLPPP